MTSIAPLDTLHATAVEWNGCGILLRGASGSGKSSIALRLIDEAKSAQDHCILVADDRVIVVPKQGRLHLKAPEILTGLIEVRGIGIIKMPVKQACALNLVVDLVPESALSRLPENAECFAEIRGASIRAIAIAERNPDAAMLIRTACTHTLSNRHHNTSQCKS